MSKNLFRAQLVLLTSNYASTAQGACANNNYKALAKVIFSIKGTIMDNFESWFSNQQSRGLVDIKFAVTPGKGVTSTAIKSELLAAEVMINAGYVKKNPPYATSVIPSDVLRVIESAHL